MGRKNLEQAERFGRSLPEFSTFAEARTTLFGIRDECLGTMQEMSSRQNIFSADYSVLSLQQLDDLYEVLYRTDSFVDFCDGRERFEQCMAMYFGEVLARRKEAEWVVEEFAFLRGRYQIGVRINTRTQMLRSFTDYYKDLQQKSHPMTEAYEEF